MQKKAYAIGKPDFPKRKLKTLQCFLFRNGSYRTPKSSPRKIREKSGKIKFHTKNRPSVLSSATLFVGVKIVRQHIYFFVLLTKMFCLFRFIGSFLFCAISESAVRPSMGCHFLDISILLNNFGVLWRPRSHRGSCQVGYIVPTSWELPI